PPADARADVLLELGELETRAGDAEADAHLGAALALGLDGDRAARAHVARGTLRLLVDPDPALDELERALADARDPGLRLRLEALVLEASTFHARFADRRAALLADGRRSADPSAVMLAHLAQDAAYGGRRTAAEVADLTARAVAAGLLADLGPLSNTYNLLIHACRYAEQADQARTLLEHGEAAARREGLRFASPYLDHASAYWHLEFGSAATGLAHAEAGLGEVRRVGFPVTVAAFSAIAAELLLQHDRPDDAAAVLDPVAPGLEETVAGPFVVAARGWVRWHQRRAADAEAELRRAVALLDERGWHTPRVADARLRLAHVLAVRGARDEAAAILDAAEATALASETGGARGAVAVVRARLADDDAAIAALEDAARLLGDSPLLLAEGWALHELGAALRRRGKRVDARTPLRAALDVAARAEAPLLARLAREELEASGARPQRAALSGPAALTPSERRVAELAAAGHSNREIAEALWVTRRTVEVHLGNAYGKLGIRGRAQLAAALAGNTGER
ncbi:MAG TPA: LuxR C-terminal-related transcriptional regulator, partial [Baekduia sp.]|nr:LuxR C-terminal-related transcriptional regulator [Baekduia sp.]